MIAPPILPGQLLDGKYRVERVIGQGGMGLVVSAIHVELDSRVAIKFLLGAPSEASAKRFLAEARAAAKIQSDHVCRASDFGRTPSGEPYIVMEYLDGHDLGAELASRGPLSAEDLVTWGRQACAGLSVAHALGIVHRDIKPANLFLVRDPGGRRKLKVLDFGISKAPGSSVTRSAVSMGSPLYMAPEQMASSRDVDARADVWSLGATLYELASGRPPFDAENVFELATMIRDGEVADLALARPDLPPALCALVARCLAKDPTSRFAHAAELDASLASVFGAARPSYVVPPAAELVPATARDALAKTAASPVFSPESAATSAISATPTATSASVSAHAARPRPARRWPLALGGLALAVLAVGMVARARTTSAPEPAGSSAVPSTTPSSVPATNAVTSTALPTASAPTAAPPPSGPTASPSSHEHRPPRPPVSPKPSSAQSAVPSSAGSPTSPKPPPRL